jgi:hypothetical protein
MKAKLVSESIYGDPYVSDTTEPNSNIPNDSKPNDDWPAPEEWTYQEGDKVKFNLMGMGSEWRSSEDRKTADVAENHSNSPATIIGQATFTEVGDPDYEYYDIQFDDGEELYAVSGYHLCSI